MHTIRSIRTLGALENLSHGENVFRRLARRCSTFCLQYPVCISANFGWPLEWGRFFFGKLGHGLFSRPINVQIARTMENQADILLFVLICYR